MIEQFRKLQILADKSLSKKDLEYIDLRIMKNLKLKEIAYIKGVSAQAVHSNVNRALEHYKKFGSVPKLV